jgi:Carboxypeptidase regulatory-like domain/TonB dependent receptor
MRMYSRLVVFAVAPFLAAFFTLSAAAQELASLNGRITDPKGLPVPGVKVRAVNVNTNVPYPGETNDVGLYSIPSLPPGTYRIIVEKEGFAQIVKPDVVLHVADVSAINFSLQIGSITQSVTVESGAPLINTESAAVSTVVDRQFAENLPLNGRSFQTLIQLTPGVVLATSNAFDSGQFTVNGQRAASNYWMVDGVSANIGVSAGNVQGNGFAGALGSFSALGGTNSLVSVDAMQEFRIQTSTYAPEFGRTPGGQISIVTRSGTNQFHGTLFDYLRNDALDANNWFNTSVTPALPKAQERQNDFGGTFTGPILKDRTFFFFSYEGQRLRLPQTALSTVPDLNARQNAAPATQPFLNAFPLPNGANLGTGRARFNASFSNKATLDAYSLRIDHKLSNALTVFARYNYSPSELVQRGAPSTALSAIQPSRITTQTATAGATWLISPAISDDLRFNYSRTRSVTNASLDNFGGAVPLMSLPFPSSFATTPNVGFFYFIIFLGNGLRDGNQGGHNLQRQINLVDNLSMQRGSHSLKFGVDFRRLSPVSDFRPYSQNVFFLSVPSAAAGNLLPFSAVGSGRTAALVFNNLGVFAQDTWRVIPRLTLTYGLRWDVDFAPSTSNGLNIPAVTGFSLNDLSQLALAPAGTSPFKTPYGNIAPRVGAAYLFHQSQGWQTVLRGGLGVFFDLATSEAGNLINLGAYPFGAIKRVSGSFPLDPIRAAPPPITPPDAANRGALAAFDPGLKLPYTLEWTVAVEQALGRQQNVSASYIGSSGSRLIQTAFVFRPNQNFGSAELVNNAGTSDYNALQIQFQRRLSHGLQALASYTWSHSIDTASAGSALGNVSNAAAPSISPNANRGPSDFDIRNAFTAGVTYDVPAPKINAFMNAILRGWSLQSIVLARSAPPVNVDDSAVFLTNVTVDIRPDLVPGIPVYLFGPQYPGGRILNNTPNQGGTGCVGPFCPPPTDPNTGAPLRQGNLGRNALRGFGTTQWDFAVHRQFPIHESVRLQFRAELFNVLNHPNFGSPIGDISNPFFGLSTQMLGQTLGGANLGGGGLSALYQIGGPRSIQFALKLQF